ncbi:hypothetical protein EJ08DRAFT_654836 [Tothia fuscella]|uniref:DM2 domain-containing protein n=1 Tax=Tothia fuscella TaxID=1048955 RepID=A0A9P4TSC8_9PEZI|nr:hypothetical protein EJ08DRAFT_654836 [Tothia fuscella]
MQANFNRNGPPRKGPGPMVANPGQYQQQPTPQQMQAAQAEEARKREEARRRSKKPTDLDLPEGIEEIVIGDAASTYRRLRDIERKLDSTMMRKKLDMQDQTQRNEKRSRTMRIFINNTADNQPWQNTSLDTDAFDFGDSSQASYKVNVQGKLLPAEDGLDSEEVEEVEEGKEAQALKNAPGIHERTRLSHYFKQITVEFKRPQALQPDGMAAIEWKRPPPDARTGAPSTADGADFDLLKFERKSDENINVEIKLYRDENPERFQLSPELAELCDTTEDDRPGVMYKLWSYIRANKLQENEDVRHIRCDYYMKKAFGTDVIQFNYIPDLILRHLHPLPPVILNYTIRVDADYVNAKPTPSPYTVYDVTVLEDDPLRTRITNTLWHSSTHVKILQQIVDIDDQIALVVQAITQGKAKHGFYEAMAKDPVGFLKRWISSQRRDMEVILGESTRGMGSADEGGLGEEWRRGGRDGVWGGDVARESVGLYLARSEAQRHR